MDCTFSPLTPELCTILFGASLVLILFFLKTKMRKVSDACRSYEPVFLNAIRSESISELEYMLATQPKITKLLETSRDKHGTTLMLTAIQYKRCKVVKYLLKHFGDKVNLHGTFEWSGTKYDNVSPLCAAIISRQAEIVLEFVSFGKGHLERVTADIKKSSLDKEHKIEALELMGAFYAFYFSIHAPSSGSRYVFSIWKEATKLRYSTVDGHQVIPKTISPPSDLFARAMGFTSEFLTLEHLEQIEAQIDLWGFRPMDTHWFRSMDTQALLVIHRILDRKDPEQHKYFLKQLCNCATRFQHFYDNRAINVGMFMLDEFQGLQEWDEETNEIIIETIGHLVKTFMILYEMRDEMPRFHHPLVFADIIKTLKFTLMHNIHQASVVNIHSRYDRCCSMIFDQIYLLTEMLPKLSNQESHQFKKILYDFIRADFKFDRVDKGDILHLACCNFFEKFPNLSAKRFRINVMKLLLELDLDPNSTSTNGKTPLHILATSSEWRWSTTTNITDAVQLLLDSGANIHQPDGEGRTPLDLFKLKEEELNNKRMPSVYLQKLIHTEGLRLRSLKCLAAQVICRNRISFAPDDLPITLLTFVKRH
jgi:hypothetical protein